MSLPIQVDVINSSKKIFDDYGYKLSIHIRMKDNVIEVIINRSCQECKEFHKIGDGTWICSKCTYKKNWLKDGLR